MHYFSCIALRKYVPLYVLLLKSTNPLKLLHILTEAVSTKERVALVNEYRAAMKIPPPPTKPRLPVVMKVVSERNPGKESAG